MDGDNRKGVCVCVCYLGLLKEKLDRNPISQSIFSELVDEKNWYQLDCFFQDGTPVQAFVAEVLNQIVGISVIRNEMVCIHICNYYYWLENPIPFKYPCNLIIFTSTNIFLFLYTHIYNLQIMLQKNIYLFKLNSHSLVSLLLQGEIWGEKKRISKWVFFLIVAYLFMQAKGCSIDAEIQNSSLTTSWIVFQDIEYIRSHYNIEDFIYFSHYQQEEHGHLYHFSINPIFHHYAKHFMKEILRLAYKSCLYYPIYPQPEEGKVNCKFFKN